MNTDFLNGIEFLEWINSHVEMGLMGFPKNKNLTKTSPNFTNRLLKRRGGLNVQDENRYSRLGER